MTVLLFMTQIKNRDTPIEVECAFKGKVIFCVWGVAIPPCGVPATVGDHVPSSTVPALSQRRMVVVNVGSLASNGSCPMLSKRFCQISGQLAESAPSG